MKIHAAKLISVLLTFHLINASARVLYVDLNNLTPTPPYTNWITSATNIQDAIDVANTGDKILVTNGVYGTGQREANGPNRVAVTKAVIVESVNPYGACIHGSNSMRCVYLASGALLSGFVVTEGNTRTQGGGIWCESSSAVVSKCSIVWNRVTYGGGGGVWSGTINDCTISYNQAHYDPIGSGACGDDNHACILNNCTISGNYTGGAYGCTLTNCILDSNLNPGAEFCTLDHCTIINNKADGGGGVRNSTLYYCVVAGNTSIGQSGGGAESSTLYHCIVSGNSSTQDGGGVTHCTLYDCELTGNSTGDYGGGASWSTLSHCNLSGNWVTSWGGGGAFECTLNYCTLFGNSARHSGGGAMGCEMNNCTLISNSVSYYGGGGARYGTLNNCTVVGNSAPKGGGALDTAFNNSIIYYNKAPTEANYGGTGLQNYSCVTPMPTNGVGNITNPPLFLQTGSNLRLKSDSPCINFGNNSYVTNVTDLDGRPRLINQIVDMGAYEFQPNTSGLFLGWLNEYDLSTDGSADYSDVDGDNFNNYQEWIAGTDPTNRLSVLKVFSPSNTIGGVKVNWQSVINRTYFLQRGTNLTLQSPFSLIQSNIVGEAGTTSFLDTTATNTGPYFYRIGVQQ